MPVSRRTTDRNHSAGMQPVGNWTTGGRHTVEVRLKDALGATVDGVFFFFYFLPWEARWHPDARFSETSGSWGVESVTWSPRGAVDSMQAGRTVVAEVCNFFLRSENVLARGMRGLDGSGRLSGPNNLKKKKKLCENNTPPQQRKSTAW
jgi:hypothetical protein